MLKEARKMESRVLIRILKFKMVFLGNVYIDRHMMGVAFLILLTQKNFSSL